MLYGDGVEPYGFSFFTEVKISPTVYTKTLTTFPEYCLIAGTPPRVIKEGIFHNRFDDIINYQ